MPVAAELTTLDNDQAKLAVSVTHDEVEKAMQRTLKQLAGDVRVPGFRPGKVPPGVVLQRFGREVVLNEMLKNSLADWYGAAVTETGVQPIDDPEFDLDDVPDEGDLTFTATVRTRPKATLGTYKGLEVGRDEPEIDGDAVDRELERLRQRASRLQQVERAAASGDFVVIDFEGRAGGKRIASASAKDYLVELGANRLMPGFDDKLIGLSAGDSAQLETAYTDDDNRPELRGRTVTYTVSVKQVQERVLPELDDDLAVEVSEFDTLDELKADLAEKAEATANARVDEMFRRRVIDAVVAEATVEVPAVMIDRRVNSILNQTAGSLPRGMSFEQYLQATGRTLQQTVDELRPDAEMAVRRELVVEAVMDAEGIEVTDADVEQQIRDDAERMGRDPEDLLAEVGREDGVFERLREDLRLGKTVELLIESANAVPMAELEAREKIWTPDEEKPGTEAKLWTPGDDEPTS